MGKIMNGSECWTWECCIWCFKNTNPQWALPYILYSRWYLLCKNYNSYPHIFYSSSPLNIDVLYLSAQVERLLEKDSDNYPFVTKRMLNLKVKIYYQNALYFLTLSSKSNLKFCLNSIYHPVYYNTTFILST